MTVKGLAFIGPEGWMSQLFSLSMTESISAWDFATRSLSRLDIAGVLFCLSPRSGTE